MKKTLCIVLITAMLLALMPLAVFADTPVGTAIDSADALKDMSSTGTYYLSEDITIEGEWSYTKFNGTLDGNGHTITFKNATVYGGLFEQFGKGTIKNLNIAQSGTTTWNKAKTTDNANNAGIGGLVAVVKEGDVLIENVTVNVQINVTVSGCRVGGIVGSAGYTDSLIFRNCVFAGSVVNNTTAGPDSFAGGILGGTWSKNVSLTFEKCINYGTVTGWEVTGGILGYTDTTDNNYATVSLTIKECINYGQVTSNADTSVGGIVGQHRIITGNAGTGKAQIVNCINYGSVHGHRKNDPTLGDVCVGGIGGRITADKMNLDSNSKFSGNISYGTLEDNHNPTDGANKISPIFANVYGQNNGTVNNAEYAHNYYAGSATPTSNATITGVAIEDAAATVEALNAVYPGMYSLLPNGKITLTWAKEAGYADATPTELDAVLVGAQLSGKATDETRNIRFVGGINTIEGLTNVGVLIIAKDAEGNQLKVFEGMTETVYKSIYADDEEVYATEYNKTYFFTAVVNNVPTDLGEVTFEVRTFQLAEDGTVVYGNAQTAVIDLEYTPEA